MKAGSSNNFSKALKRLRREVGGRTTFRARLSNSADYARPLHDKQGFYVFNPQHFRRSVYLALRGLAKSPASFTRQNVRLAIEAGCVEEIAYLRSLTDEMRPPAPVNSAGRYIPVAERTGMRRAHPGHWADVSKNLASSYDHDVEIVA